ncbi:hypothetical protein Hamer_G000524, partial [Homarus americanus]
VNSVSDRSWCTDRLEQQLYILTMNGKHTSAHSLVTEAHVKAVLKADKGNDILLTSWAIEDFTEKGDNLATVVTSVKVMFSHNDSVQRISYVVCNVVIHWLVQIVNLCVNVQNISNYTKAFGAVLFKFQPNVIVHIIH